MKKQLLLLVCILSGCELLAQHVTEEQALQKAQAFMQGKVMNNVGGRNNVPAKPRGMKRVVQATPTDALYLFNVEDNGGFVIVSSDERTDEILGYSTEGHIDPQQMPENMRAWLKGYEEQIKAIPANATAMPAKVPTHPAVEPLITAKWDQGAPYNLQCPEIDGQHCATGCVATAMAQIMYYWKWPQDYTTMIPGWGYGDATWNDETGEYDYSDHYPDLPPTQFDWEHMKDSYRGDEADASADAVAELMYYCGWATRMYYSPWSSYTYEYFCPLALYQYFGYDQNLLYITRATCLGDFRNDYGYTNGEWDDLIYGELQAGRPVLYGGSGNSGGHEFVCDGYDGEGMYHFNWGWGGTENCYCKLSIVAPGFFLDENGYSNGQSVVVGIQPPTGLPKDYSKAIRTYLYVVEHEGESHLLFGTHAMSIYGMTVDLALRIEDELGNVTMKDMFTEYFKDGFDKLYQGSASHFSRSYFEDLSDGTYHFVAMYKEQSETEWHLGQSIDVVLSEGTISDARPPLNLEVVNIEMGGSMIPGEQQYAEVTLKANGGECNTTIHYAITQSDEFENFHEWDSWVQVFVNEGETESVRIHFTPTEAGNFNFVIGVYQGWNERIDYEDGSALFQSVFDRHHVSFSVSKPLNIHMSHSFDWSSKTMSISVDNYDEVAYDHEVAVRICTCEDYGKDDAGQVFKSEKLHIEPGQSVDVDIECADLSIDNLYLVDLMCCKNPDRDEMSYCIRYNKLQMMSKGRFTVNGIQYVIVDEERHYVFASSCNTDASQQLTVPATVVSPKDGVSYTVKGISKYFCQNNDVATLSFSYGITTIDNIALQGCESLETIVLPGSLTRIGGGMIYGCPNLKAIYSKAHEAPLLVDYGVSNYLIGWDEKYDNITLYVPMSSRDSYAKSWPQFTNIVEMDVADMPSTTPEDLTARVGTSQEDWNASGMVGWAAPEVTTRDGRTTPLAERYEETAGTTGTMMEQTVTGLQSGMYRMTLYANACYTPDRGFGSGITDGQTDVVYLFANSTQKWIPARIADSVEQNGEYTLTCNVTDGTLRLGMVAAKPGTNWHSMQIKSLDRVGDIPTDIADSRGLPLSTADIHVYDLQGRRVSNAQFIMHNAQFIRHNAQLKKGLYIRGGRKVVVR